MRVLLADPPAFTPQYDHALASALARAGAEVELVTSPFRFGEPPEPDGYRRSELFYPVSSRVFRRSRLRIPVKLLEHPVGLARLRRRRADVAHLQWLAAPELDDRLLRLRAAARLHRARPAPAAHRREARSLAPALRPLRADRRPQRARPRPARRAGRPGAAPRHPAPGLPERSARTARRRPDAPLPRDHPRVQGHRRRDRGGEGESTARGSSSPAIRSSSVDALPGSGGRQGRVAPRLSLGRGDRPALGDATVALFPYRPEIDQSGALLRALGAGVPVVAYDVGGLGEPVRRFGAGRVVPAGDVDALTEAARELLDDPQRARGGPRRRAARASRS